MSCANSFVVSKTTPSSCNNFIKVELGTPVSKLSIIFKKLSSDNILKFCTAFLKVTLSAANTLVNSTKGSSILPIICLSKLIIFILLLEKC